MKRTWIAYVAIAAAVAAGTLCSTALADKPGRGGGAKFSGGGSSFRSLSGGMSSNKATFNKPPVTLNRNVGNLGSNFGGSGPKIQSQPLSGRIGGLNKIGGNSGITHKPAVISGNQGINLGGSINKITTRPGLGISGQNLQPGKIGIQTGPKIGTTPKLGINVGNGISLGGNNGGQFGGGLNKIGVQLGKNGAFCGTNPAKCVPCDPCHNNKHCHNFWWWNPTYCQPQCKPCYTHTVVVTQPIAVPVAVPVAGQVAPAVATEPVAQQPLTQVPNGAAITLQGTDLGDTAGQLVLVFGTISMPAQVTAWSPTAMSGTLPTLGLAEATKAQLWLVRADGTVAANMDIELIPVTAEQAAAAAATQPAAATAVEASAAASLFGQ
ncbi:MAG: hypothetical protein MUF06_10380 [Pirellulaceae bacterium]|jgi:hypothetical protein|nr:hypothetical protein [Pirellulaceae bacterium]